MKVGKNTKIWHPELSNILNCEIGNDCVIHASVWIGDNVKIGNKVKIQAFCFIPDGITIEDNCFIGPGVIFTNDKYPPSHGQHWSKTLVKEEASIGAGVVILPGIIIGRQAMIGAGAVVTENVMAFTTVVGNPARRI